MLQKAFDQQMSLPTYHTILLHNSKKINDVQWKWESYTTHIYTIHQTFGYVHT